MSKGKYSPTPWKRNRDRDEDENDFIYNAKGELPAPYDHTKDTLIEEIHIDGYDKEGYDSYGYSAYTRNGKFVGCGQGVDRNGYTEDDYLMMSDEEFENHY